MQRGICKRKIKKISKFFLGVVWGFHSHAIRAHHNSSAQSKLEFAHHSTMHHDAPVRAEFPRIMAPARMTCDLATHRSNEWTMGASRNWSVHEHHPFGLYFPHFLARQSMCGPKQE